MTGVWDTPYKEPRIVNGTKYTRILENQYVMSQWYGEPPKDFELNWTKIAPSHLTVWKE